MATRISSYRPLKSAGNVKSFYDDIIYWEIAKNNNKFYVTFMRGEYAIPNNKQESIGTMEISYPHVANGFADSTTSFKTGFNRVNAQPDTFLQNEESSSVGAPIANSHNYNGFIPITELGSLRYWKTTITGSLTEKTYQYEIFDANIGSTIVSRSIDAAYFYPFSSHQLSVLRDEPTLIINMDKESELNDGLGDSGFVIVPQNCHPKVKNNIEYYLEKAGLIEKTTKFKNPSTRR